MWFKELVGFEESREAVYENIEVEGVVMRSKANGKMFRVGKFEMSSVSSLQRNLNYGTYNGVMTLEEVVGNVQDFHTDRKNANAVFQAASQFNMLEMVSPNITPERGVDVYENDRTQGPACAIACGPGTIFRNYFVDVNGQIGQTESQQLNGLGLWEDYFDNSEHHFWRLQNGYAFFTQDGLEEISQHIKSLSKEEREILKSHLMVGVQWNTQVTLAAQPHMVTQVYCSAIPIGYSSYIPTKKFEEVARLILEATYEATFLVAIKNYQETGEPQLFLTLVGGGVFANPEEWIWDAIEQCLLKYKHVPLKVKIVSYGRSNAWLKDKIDTFCINNF